MWPALIPFLGTIIDKIFPNAEDAQKAKLELLKIQADNDQKQLEVNAKEAENTNLFVSGWRPFIGWVCASIFCYNFLLQPLIVFIITITSHPIQNIPHLETGEIMPVLLGLLGLGGLRSYEKINGVAKK